MQKVIIAILIVIAIAGIGFGIYQQINISNIKSQPGPTAQELTNKYEANKTELINKYEAELKNIKESNDQSIQQLEAEIKKIKESLAPRTETAAKTTNGGSKTISVILKRLQSTTDVYTNKPVATDPTSFAVRNNRSNYKDYSTKVMDAEIELDQYINDEEEPLPADARDLITKAMDCYIDALSIWEIEINQGQKEVPKGEPEKEKANRTSLEKTRLIEKSISYGNKYQGLAAPPYIKLLPEGYILLPSKAITFVWALASQYVNQADKILSQNAK